jgi:hypothetical protein
MKTLEKIKRAGYKMAALVGHRNGMQTIIGWQLKKDGGITIDKDCGLFPSPTQALNYIQGKSYRKLS